MLLIISSQLTFSTSSMLEMLTEPFMREKCALAAAMRVTYRSGVGGLGFQPWKPCGIPNSELYTPLMIIIQSSFICTLKWKQELLVPVREISVVIRPVSRIQFHHLSQTQGRPRTKAASDHFNPVSQKSQTKQQQQKAWRNLENQTLLPLS